MTSLIGRDEALAAVGRWLDDATSRLLTFTGPAGSGKTRLALEAAQRTGDDRDVYWVSLAEVFDHRLVADVVANTIGLARGDQ